MVVKKEQKNSEKLKENIAHGNILFNLAVHLTENKIPSDIMLYTHWHEELEILYILEGSMLLQIDAQAFMVSKGDIILIPPNLVHGATGCSNYHCSFYAIVFHPSFIFSALNDIIQQSYLEPFFIKNDKSFYYIDEKSKDQDKILHNVTSIIEAYNSRGFGFELLIKSYVLQILYHLLEINFDKKNELSKDDLLTTLRIKKILTFLHDNYQKSFSLRDWASNIDLSKEQFCRIFKKHFNKTPIEYLMHYRISKAADLLIHSDLPIIDIAFETGFESANYFTIVFKNKTQMTPRQFRNSHGGL
jgi:AraC-like DNA-binding protein/mannose-6-phosphate isomerase-like protein (cupin superfamily)